MALKFRQSLLLTLVGKVSFLYGCQAESPTPKQSSTRDLLAQVEAIEADEAALLFQQAKAAAEKDNVKEARSLIQQALGRGAGSMGMTEAEAEIKKAEARIAEKKRKAEEARRAREAEENRVASNSYIPQKGDEEPRWITVQADGNSFGATVSRFTLERQFGNFGNNGQGSYVTIHKPYSGKMGGTYSFSLHRASGGVFIGDGSAICSGSFSISGYKSNVNIIVYDTCQLHISEF